MNLTVALSRSFVAAAVCLTSLLPSMIFGQQRFLVELRDGNRLSVDLRDKPIDWAEVGESGTVVKSKINLFGVKRIDLAMSPASVQAMRIQSLTHQLQSDDYHKRDEAEKALLAEARPFIGILKANQDSTANKEAKYRIERIIRMLGKTDSGQRRAEYDHIILDDGTALAGDAGKWTVESEFAGQKISLDRSKVLSIEKIQDIDAESKPPWKNAFFHEPKDFFFIKGQRTIDFDAGPNQRGYAKDDQVNTAFEKWGCLLSAESDNTPSNVIITTFRITNSKSNGHSAANETPKYKGAVHVRFCVPGNPDVPAAIHRIGMYIAVVDNPREIIVEALNDSGHVVAYCEALEAYGFAGLESPFPIASVRIQPNLALDKPAKDIDEDFAIDDLCFNEPTELPLLGAPGKFTLVLKNGSRLVFDDFEMKDLDFVIPKMSFLEKQVSISRRDVRALITAQEIKPVAESDVAYAMLQDHSIILVKAAERLIASNFDNFKIDPAELRAIWGAQTQLRYPVDADFEKGDTVIVKPTHRVVPKTLDIDSQGLSWDAEQAEIIEQLVFDEKTPSVSPIGKVTSYQYHELPSVWFGKPEIQSDNTGLVRLTDGRQFVLGGESGFELDSMGREAIVVSRDTQKYEIPLSRVVAVRFAN